ncbi:protein kinase [Actinomadura nitritigenes]|uniref:protein kinase n=1 Tax=Actinomadura nitritigenes TaxID=134602 RepID=UPI003D8FA549
MPDLMDAIGIQGYRKHRTVGTWRLEPKALDAGPTWEDYLAENTALEGDYRRIRLYLSELGASREAQESTRRAARREYLVLQGLDHPGIVKVEQFSDDHDAGPAIVFPHRPEWLRLDHYMAQYGDGLDVETRLGMIRQLAEAVAHAHRRHLYHRGLWLVDLWRVVAIRRLITTTRRRSTHRGTRSVATLGRGGGWCGCRQAPDIRSGTSGFGSLWRIERRTVQAGRVARSRPVRTTQPAKTAVKIHGFLPPTT